MMAVDDPTGAAAESPSEMGRGQAAITKRDWVKVWDLPLRMFHWVLVLSIAVAFLSSEEASALNDWHVLSGWVAAILLVFRLVWGFVGGEHSRFSDFIRPASITDHVAGLFRGRREAHLGHNPLGAVAVLLLLALTGLTVWTGAFGGEAMEELHELVAWTLLGLVVLHVAAVILMSIVEKENLARAMISGDKPAARHPGAVDAKPPSALGLIIAALVIVGTAVAILQYDPQAFTRRSAEAFEHRIAARADSAHEADHEGDED
jgi:cytochrome b